MKRIVLPDGRWFDGDLATRWGESTHLDGKDRVSDVTGSRQRHEELYRTANGTWIVHVMSDLAAEPEHLWRLVDPIEAARWLVINGYEAPGDLAKHEKALEL